MFFVSKFSSDGNLEGVKVTTGKQIDNPNTDVNVNPVIISNSETNSYNIIDGDTGVILDSTPYNSILTATINFNEKMKNLDEAQIKVINNKKAQAKQNESK